MPEIDRRRLLGGMGAVAGAGAARRLRVPERARAATAPFGWGVASFDPTTTSVLLWTRATPASGTGPVALTWTVAEDAALARPVATGRVTATSDADHTVRVEVGDLAAGRTWHYAFTAPDGTRSPVGRTRTLGAEPERLRLGLVSCSRFAAGGFAAYRALAERDVDLVVHVGDYIYEDGVADVRPHQPAHRCTTLADYRERYAQHRADPDLQALHAAHPMVAVWDDHEVAGNAWRDGAAAHSDARDGPWLRRLLAAGRAHEEWVPGRTSRGDDGRLKAWRTIDLGTLAELVVLDTRHWGRDRQPATAAELDDTDAPRTLLGPDQAAFVNERLQRADRRPWTFLANQVMLHPLEIPAPTQSIVDAAARGGFLVSGGHAVNPDQWDGYPTAREELLHAIGGRGGVVALTGDVHSSWAWEGPANDGGDPTMVELVSPSATTQTFADRLSIPASLIELGLTATEPDLQHVELTSHGYVLVDCTADRVQGEWWYVDPGDVTTQHLGAARSAPREPPMHLRDVDDPTEDRTAGPDGQISDEAPASDDDPPLALIGGGAAWFLGLLGAAIWVRRRRR